MMRCKLQILLKDDETQCVNQKDYQSNFDRVLKTYKFYCQQQKINFYSFVNQNFGYKMRALLVTVPFILVLFFATCGQGGNVLVRQIFRILNFSKLAILPIF